MQRARCHCNKRIVHLVRVLPRASVPPPGAFSFRIHWIVKISRQDNNELQWCYGCIIMRATKYTRTQRISSEHFSVCVWCTVQCIYMALKIYINLSIIANKIPFYSLSFLLITGCVFDVKVYFIYILFKDRTMMCSACIWCSLYRESICDNIVCEFNVCRARAFKPFDAIAQTLYVCTMRVFGYPLKIVNVQSASIVVAYAAALTSKHTSSY